MRDSRGRSASPRRLGAALGQVRADLQPLTPLAAVETVWERAVGAGIAAVTRVQGEQDGVLTVLCESAVWAQELTLMEPQIRRQLADLIGDEAPAAIRFRAG